MGKVSQSYQIKHRIRIISTTYIVGETLSGLGYSSHIIDSTNARNV